MKGRKPKPTALKLLEGNRPDRINDREPVAARGLPKAPDWIGPIALEHWKELATVLDGLGVLTTGDGPALAVLCDAFERMQIEETGTARSRARADYVRLLLEFGLTPASRSKVKVAEQPADALGDFLKSKRQKA